MVKEICTICKNKEEYIEAIDKLINTAVTPEIENARIDFANSHSWERSVEEIYKNIKNNLK